MRKRRVIIFSWAQRTVVTHLGKLLSAMRGASLLPGYCDEWSDAGVFVCITPPPPSVCLCIWGGSMRVYVYMGGCACMYVCVHVCVNMGVCAFVTHPHVRTLYRPAPRPGAARPWARLRCAALDEGRRSPSRRPRPRWWRRQPGRGAGPSARSGRSGGAATRPRC